MDTAMKGRKKFMKVKLDGVQETLLIPLIARAAETKKANPRINDKNAVEVVNKIDYDFSKFEKASSQQGVIARTMILDRETQRFVEEHPDGICIAIGCGLDTRYHRICHKNITWYNLDFPDVIALRNKVLDEGNQIKSIGKSALDASWTLEVTEQNKAVLIILEGILMYFAEEEVLQLLAILKEHFPGCTILAEIMNPFIATQSKHHDTVKKTSAVFKWGIRSGKDMEKMCDGLRFVREWNLFDELTDQGFFFKIAPKLPLIRNINNKIVLLRMESC